jgi:hypothetical protein
MTAVLLLFFAPRLLADITTTALTGRVTIAGAAAENVTVTAESAVLQQPRVTVTGPAGTYWLGALPPGQYDVTFARTGLQTLTRRAVVELARIARADAQLEPSEEEESVSSTATTISVAHDAALTTSRTAKDLDLLPISAGFNAAFYLAPPGATVPLPWLDGSRTPFDTDLLHGETVDELTQVRGVTPVELAIGADSAVVVRTRSGGEAFSLSVRDTITDTAWLGDLFGDIGDRGVKHFLESASGGRIVPQRLWFFAGGWSGDRSDGVVRNADGLELKLTAQLDPRQNVTAEYAKTTSEEQLDGTDFEVSFASLAHVAQWGPHLTSELSAARVKAAQEFAGLFADNAENVFSAKASYVVPGDHVVSGGIDASEGAFGDVRSLFVNDRVWLQRWLINAGVRYQNKVSLPFFSPGAPLPTGARLGGQIAVVYDLLGRGRNAATASFSRYSVPVYDSIDELTLGYVMALGSTGSARVDAIRREYANHLTTNSLQLDTAYRLFDRFEAGLNYTYTDTARDASVFPLVSPNVANAWFTADLPLGEHALAATIAYRYATTPFPLFSGTSAQHSFDLALRYTLPVLRVAVTFAADAQNVFDQGNGAQMPRVMRGWIRVRL